MNCCGADVVKFAEGYIARLGVAGGRRSDGVEERLGVDDPLGLAQGGEIAIEGGGLGERGEGAVEAQAALAEVAFKLLEEEGAEAAVEDADGQEEAGPAGDPAVAGGGEAAARDDAVEVGIRGDKGASSPATKSNAQAGSEVRAESRRSGQIDAESWPNPNMKRPNGIDVDSPS